MKFKRDERNPILKPIKKNKWESRSVFNCGVEYDKEKNLIHMLYRAVGHDKNYISRLGYAAFKVVNGSIKLVERKNKPVYGPGREYDKWACEDPRITKIGDRYYVTYSALFKPATKGGGPPRVALASTKDFINFKRHGIITPKGGDERDTVLFPEKINGKYVMIHRPYNWTKSCVYKKKGKLYLKIKERTIEWPLKEKLVFPEKSSMWIAYSHDLKNWFGHKILMEPEKNWQSEKIGAGPPPIKTKKGWLLIYHGVGSEANNKSVKKYQAGAVLLDLKDPSKVIARSKKPIFKPEKNYEISGDVDNVVFPEGTVVIDGKLFVFYGAVDETCCLATCNLKKLVDFLLKNKEGLKKGK